MHDQLSSMMTKITPNQILTVFTCFPEMDPFSLFPPEISILIIQQSENVIPCSLVCKRWHFLCNSNALWRELLLQHSINPKTTKWIKEITKMPNVRSWKFLDHSWLRFVQEPKQLFKELTECPREPFLMDVIAAPHAESSSDHRNQTIDMTLDRSCRTFWSSTGFPTEECSHFLTYKLDQDCMIAYVSVKPYRSAYQHQMPTYAPSFVTIAVGLTPDHHHFKSERYPVHPKNSTQLFYLPHMVFGRYVTVFMEEAIQKQHGDNLHYVAIEHVACKGIPLKMLEHYPTITSLVRSVFAKEKQRPLAIDTEALREYMNDLDTTDRILSFLEEGRWKTAADMIIQSSEGSLARSNPMLEAFLAGLSKVTPYGNQDWVFQCLDYFFDQFVVHQVQLLHHEATCLAAVSVLRGEVETVYNCLREELIECTVELGNIFYQVSVDLALQFYSRANCFDKVIECYVKMNKFGAAAEWTLRSYDPDQITSLLRQLTVGHPRSVLHLFSMAMLR